MESETPVLAPCPGKPVWGLLALTQELLEWSVGYRVRSLKVWAIILDLPMAEVTRSGFLSYHLQSGSGVIHSAHPSEALKPQLPNVASVSKSSLGCLHRTARLPTFSYSDSSALNSRCSLHPW